MPMYDFTYSTNYTKGSYDVEENHYNQEYQSGILYLCDNGEEFIVIDYKVPVIEEIEDSPVEVILDGLSWFFISSSFNLVVLDISIKLDEIDEKIENN